MTDTTKYAVVIISKACPSMKVLEGDRFNVIKTTDWGPTTIYEGTEPMVECKRLLLFDKPEDAERFANNWQEHPWWVRRKSYEIVKVRPVYKQVLSGWEKTDE